MSQGLGDLENVYFEENAYLETLYNHEQPEVDMHFKSISDAEMSLDKEELLKSLKQEKTKMHSHYANKHSLVEHQFSNDSALSTSSVYSIPINLYRAC